MCCARKRSRRELLTPYLQLSDQAAVAERKLRLDSRLDSAQAQLLQPPRLELEGEEPARSAYGWPRQSASAARSRCAASAGWIRPARPLLDRLLELTASTSRDRSRADSRRRRAR